MNVKTPLHGGSVRVAFDGGSEIRRSLPFNAASVNIDNLSPYWYRLNPIEEYIPPFQTGVNIKLPYINNFEFVPVAPPGIEQPTIVATAGIPGNTYPVIALFSSLDTNNDSGNSAIAQAANVSRSITNISGVSNLDVATIDLTLYNGVYVYITTRDVDINIISFRFGSVTFLSQSMYRNEKILFTIPKIGKTLTINVQEPSAGAIEIDYSYRPFIGYADASVTPIGFTGANPPIQGNLRSVTGPTGTTFNVVGVTNAVITVKTRSGGGVISTSLFWVRVTISDFFSTGSTEIYSKSYHWGDGTRGLIIPINNILQGQATSIVVSMVVAPAGAVTDIALHHTFKPADVTPYITPMPYMLQTAVGVAGGANVLMMTLPVGGQLTGVLVSVLNAGATVGAFMRVFVGNAVGPVFDIGTVPMNAVDAIMLNEFRPIPFYSGFSSIWVNHNNAAVMSIALTAYLD